jgi:hypothetical protein
MKLPTIIPRQKQFIDYLYKFRYIAIKQFLQLYNINDPKYTRELLDDLIAKKYIAKIKDKKDPTKPIIYCLAQRAGHILKKEEDIDEDFLNWLYKEKTKGVNFINRNLFILNIYLFLLKNKEPGEEIYFYTKQDLVGYDYFPDPLPDAYIDIEDENGHTYYFLDFFDTNARPGNLRFRVRYYFDYFEEEKWQENTDNSSFPSILFVCHDDNRKKYLQYYLKAKLENSFNDIQFFLTTKNNVNFAPQGVNIWKQVE